MTQPQVSPNISATVVAGKATPRGKYPHIKRAGDFLGLRIAFSVAPARLLEPEPAAVGKRPGVFLESGMQCHSRAPCFPAAMIDIVPSL